MKLYSHSTITVVEMHSKHRYTNSFFFSNNVACTTANNIAKDILLLGTTLMIMLFNKQQNHYEFIEKKKTFDHFVVVSFATMLTVTLVDLMFLKLKA